MVLLTCCECRPGRCLEGLAWGEGLLSGHCAYVSPSPHLKRYICPLHCRAYCQKLGEMSLLCNTVINLGNCRPEHKLQNFLWLVLRGLMVLVRQLSCSPNGTTKGPEVGTHAKPHWDSPELGQNQSAQTGFKQSFLSVSVSHSVGVSCFLNIIWFLRTFPIQHRCNF